MTQADWFIPAQAYVPGRTARPPEGLFDPIRASAQPGMTPADLAHSDAFRHGLFYLERGFYWEAHEVLEPVWMVLPEGSAERRFVQALIQTANGQLKLRMDRPKAALRLCAIVRELLPEARGVQIMTFGADRVHAMIDSIEVIARCEL
ncbi:hypothetical protein ANTHELSMS3_04345 [Antarctobacter heliothermus]|uniref:DUF309 domain-containing protein n=1 Tax=Antarctobacter heliothermus TaxID=74033 RepID=A0A222EA84_9RHOB|nr:DUF309 domain-containing protein [Antarctobacter heliothermus]ASP22948.1 hypothetical protein ANTHELSMS3_04345 [Antarctobacter heliothermus]